MPETAKPLLIFRRVYNNKGRKMFLPLSVFTSEEMVKSYQQFFVHNFWVRMNHYIPSEINISLTLQSFSK